MSSEQQAISNGNLNESTVTDDLELLLTVLPPRIADALEHVGDEYRKEPFLTASGDLSHHLENFPPIFEVQKDSKGNSKIFSGTSWEELAGYCRAIKTGSRIHISGTTATHGPHAIGGSDPAAQAHFIIDKIEAALLSLGGRLEDVVRTRIFVKHMKDWEVVARVHGERFKSIQPANTLVQADLVGEEYLVEMEAEAEVQTKD